jgi:hypothetical protein
MAGGRAPLPVRGLNGQAVHNQGRCQQAEGGEEGDRRARHHLATGSSTVTEHHDDALNSTTPWDAAEPFSGAADRGSQQHNARSASSWRASRWQAGQPCPSIPPADCGHRPTRVTTSRANVAYYATSSGMTTRVVSGRANGPAGLGTNGPWPGPARVGGSWPGAADTRNASPTSSLRWCPGQDLWDRAGRRRCDRRAIRATWRATPPPVRPQRPAPSADQYQRRHRTWRRRQPRRS